MVVEVGKELGSDEEVLTAVCPTGRLDELVMDSTFSTLVHTLIDHRVVSESRPRKWREERNLVDLIDEGEGSMGLFGHAHEVQDGRQ